MIVERKLRTRRLGLFARYRNYSQVTSWLADGFMGLAGHFPRLSRSLGSRPVEFHLKRFPGRLAARLGSSDRSVLHEVFMVGEYDQALAALGESPVELIVDLGANVGYTVRLWMAHFPGARILAVEPSSGNYAACLLNVQNGPSPGRVTVERAFIGESDGVAWLDTAIDEKNFRMVNRAAAGAESAPRLAMPTLLAKAGERGRVDLLKCDIEGSERELFRDCSAWINQVRCVVVEFHPPYDMQALLADITRGGAEVEAAWFLSKAETGWGNGTATVRLAQRAGG